MNQEPEGRDFPEPDHVSAPPPQVMLDPELFYYGGKYSLDETLNALKRLPGNFAQQLEHYLSTSKDLSTRFIARLFRDFSSWLWLQNDFFSFFTAPRAIPIQKKFNDELWTHHPHDNELSRVRSDNMAELFNPDTPENWPNLVLTSNHARAWQSKDLVDVMRGVEHLAREAWPHEPALRLHHLKDKKAGERNPDVKGKTIIALACHTEKDMYLNGAELIDRRLDLLEDEKGNKDPAERTLKHMSPAAMRLAKLMMKLMVEPPKGDFKLVDLNVAKRGYQGSPFIAGNHRETVVLRKDATSIAQHIKLVGYSKAANTVTDALRFLYCEFAQLEKAGRLQARNSDGTCRKVTGGPKDGTIKTIISNIGLLSLAPGEVPLTAAEKNIAGIKRVTILNTHDLTAGHLVNPVADQFDRWSDRLVTIEGSIAESGHSIVDALGRPEVRNDRAEVIEEAKPGFIMNAANDRKYNYRTAQDEVRAFFASNHHVHAISTLCLSADGNARGGMDNVMLAQFAPGVTRAEEAAIQSHMVEALKKHGFKNPDFKSDFRDMRRVRVVLDHDGAKHPIVVNQPTQNSLYGPIMKVDHTKISRLRAALGDIKQAANNALFVTTDVDDSLHELMEYYPDTSVQGKKMLTFGLGSGTTSSKSKRAS